MVAIPDEFYKSAVFLSVDEHTPSGVVQRIPKATAFLISVPLEENPEAQVGYFVTARHCLYGARSEGHAEIFLRLNLKGDTGFEEFPTKIDDWYVSDLADVAVVPFVPAHLLGARTFFEFDLFAFKMNSFVGPGPDYRFVGQSGDGFPLNIQPRVGNEIYHIGLFTQHYGKERNLPVARFGHISRMPSLIEFADPGGITYESAAYLAEFHSWGGHSGSPVYFLEPQTFVTVEVDEKDNETGRGRIDVGWVSGFLGMVSAHFDIDQKGKVTGELGTVETALNSGIATVVPADTIRSLLLSEPLVEHRAELKREMDAKFPTPTLDFAGSNPVQTSMS